MLLPTERLLAARHSPDGSRLQRKTDELSTEMFGDFLEPASGEARSTDASTAEEKHEASSNVVATLPAGSPFGIDISFLQVALPHDPPCSGLEPGTQGREAQPFDLVNGQGIGAEAIAEAIDLALHPQTSGCAELNSDNGHAEGLPKEPAGRRTGIQKPRNIEPSLEIRIEKSSVETARQEPSHDRGVEGKTLAPSPPSGESITPPNPQPSQMPVAQPSPPPIRQVLNEFDRLFQSTYVSPALPVAPGQAESDVRSLRLTLRPDHLGEVEVSLHRTGNEMRVRIVVTSEATARALEGDLNLLRDKIDQLMQADVATAVTVTFDAPDEKPQSFLTQGSGNGTGLTGSNGSLADSTGERQAPRKRVAGSSQTENDLPDRNPLLHLGPAHIVV